MQEGLGVGSSSLEHHQGTPPSLPPQNQSSSRLESLAPTEPWVGLVVPQPLHLYCPGVVGGGGDPPAIRAGDWPEDMSSLGPCQLPHIHPCLLRPHRCPGPKSLPLTGGLAALGSRPADAADVRAGCPGLLSHHLPSAGLLGGVKSPCSFTLWQRGGGDRVPVSVLAW